MNLKYSRQREAIKAMLMTRYDHPTADMVYADIRKEYPNISLGTVYRNLTLLSSLGEIQKLDMGDGVDHFDGNASPHFHFLCTSCHSVIDLPLDKNALKGIDELAGNDFDGKICGHITHFYGLCGRCNENKSN